ncbi:MAG: hypothetical protein WCW56_00065 [Candidatus Paceibacterota bacterium]|jgi:hypothetical protein
MVGRDGDPIFKPGHVPEVKPGVVATSPTNKWFHLRQAGIKVGDLGRTTPNLANAQLRKKANRSGVDYHTDKNKVFEVETDSRHRE